MGGVYCHVVIDFYDNQGLDEEGIADFATALIVMFSSDRETEFAIVNHRDSLEWERDKLIYWDWFMHERSYYNRSDAIEGIRKRTRAQHPFTCPSLSQLVLGHFLQ